MEHHDIFAQVRMFFFLVSKDVINLMANCWFND